MMGASKRTVCRRSPSIVSAAEADKSQMMAFQSRDAVRRYRELPDQLRVKVPGQLGVRKALPHACVSFARARCRPALQERVAVRACSDSREQEVGTQRRRRSSTHQTDVTALTCPSSQRTTLRVSKSSTAT